MLGLQGSTHHHDQRVGDVLQPPVSLLCAVSERKPEILLSVGFVATWIPWAHQTFCKLSCIHHMYHEFGAETIVKGIFDHILNMSTVIP